MDFSLVIKGEIDKVFKSNPDLHDHRKEYPWVTGFLGNPNSRIIFLAENPSLAKMKEATARAQVLDEESQWNISNGDEKFRQTLVETGFKKGTIKTKGGWSCYITNIVKMAVQPTEWAMMEDEERFAIVRKFAPILQIEINIIDPLIIVIMGKTRLKRLFNRLVREGLIKYLDKTHIEYVWHYAYFNRGGYNETNLTQYRKDFRKIKELLYNKLQE